MYAFIEKADLISDTFAECIGGLVSVVAQNIQMTVESANNVKINRCLSQGYTINVIKEKEKYNLAINDIQSEEHRDIIFELSIPQIDQPNNKFDILKASIQYKNVATKNDKYSTDIVCSIERNEDDVTGDRNADLDLQINRILAANAMSDADSLAQQGKLEEARKLLDAAANNINTSTTANDAYANNLVNELVTVQTKLNNQQEYQQYGSKMLNMNAKAHNMQRSVQSSAFSSQAAYENKSKKKMKENFK